MELPSYRYHKSGASRIVNDEAEHNELMATGEWAETPAAFPSVPTPTSCATCGRPFDAPAPVEDATEAATDASDPATAAKTKAARKPAAK